MAIQQVKRLITNRQLSDRLSANLYNWARGAMQRINQKTPLETGRLRSTATVQPTWEAGQPSVIFWWDKGLHTPEGYARQLEFSDYSPRTSGTEIPWAHPGVEREARGPELGAAIKDAFE